jgi:hypothetical protein
MQKSDKGKNNLHIKNWPEGDRPREMLLEKGPEALSDAVLLAILTVEDTSPFVFPKYRKIDIKPLSML